MITRECSRFAVCESWSRLGARAELPAELRAHCAECEECRPFVEEVLALRGRLATPLAAVVPDQRCNEIRFTLMAAARAAQRERKVAFRLGSLRGGPGARRAVAAGALLLVAVLTVLVVRSARSPLGTRSTFAEVRLEPNAIGQPLRPAPAELYSLYDGTASFAVQHLGPGQSYQVVVGKDRVEVRGTRFVLEAERGELAAVHVSEGLVLVYSNGASVARLPAGESWSRARARAAAQIAKPALADPGSGDATRESADASARREEETSSARPDEARPSRAQPAAPAHSTAASTAPLHRSDSAFRSAWLLLQGGKAAEAARGFDALSRDPSLDPERRADALYWAARAHERAGSPGAAQARAEELAESLPNAWHAPEAALLVGESLIRNGDRSAARRWLERARTSGSGEVRARAEALLAELDASAP